MDLTLPNNAKASDSVPEYVANVANKLEKAYDVVRTNLAKAGESASKWHNRRTHLAKFQPGEAVRIFYPRRYPGRTPKWQSFYRTEGWVKHRLNDAAYIVRSKAWKGPKVIHVDKLKPVRQFE